MPNNYEQYTSVYEEVLSPSFLNQMTDLLFVDKKLNWNISQQAVDSYVSLFCCLTLEFFRQIGYCSH